ncbi:hypothetical protein FOZ63_025602 [Perkinsus olseni]|uniref:Uncharacterized protein n=1 Tax=Perkinsus olseni TaxID=32597 RepID=A0A7J6UF69_PEROL|nr:hypothetical protein FOZ62_004026 [Perkinsus olseni]KAF4755855.1 hypothetical protein FOZ63_025602 [Perkinsus olseni]
MRAALLAMAVAGTCVSGQDVENSEPSAEFSAVGYPVTTRGSYQKPHGLCKKTCLRASGCFCDRPGEPVAFTADRYTVGAICAAKYCSSSSDCPAGPHGTTPVCANRRCHLGCKKDYNCPWPARCEHSKKLGNVCFFPQWQE